MSRNGARPFPIRSCQPLGSNSSLPVLVVRHGTRLGERHASRQSPLPQTRCCWIGFGTAPWTACAWADHAAGPGGLLDRAPRSPRRPAAWPWGTGTTTPPEVDAQQRDALRCSSAVGGVGQRPRPPGAPAARTGARARQPITPAGTAGSLAHTSRTAAPPWDRRRRARLRSSPRRSPPSARGTAGTNPGPHGGRRCTRPSCPG